MLQVGSRSFADADALEKLVIHAATEYDLNGYAEDFDGVEITDGEYDDLVRVLKREKPNSSAFDGTSPSQAQRTGKTVVHDPPMTSIDKADGTLEEKDDRYNTFKADLEKALGRPLKADDIAGSYKHDGVAVRCNYRLKTVKGKKVSVLVSAGLRPRDGINGTDVTRHMKHIKGVPLQLPLPVELSLNGEIECWIDDFEAINAEQDAAGEDPYKNPRNYTNGCLGRDDPDENKNARLRITFHSISGFDDASDYYKTMVERAKWANSTEGLNLQDDKGKGLFVQVRSHKYEHLAIMEDYAKKLPYYTDGVVLMANDIQTYLDMGHQGDDPINAPRGALAWKFQEETADVEVDYIEWNASRTGRVVPKVYFTEAVTLADTDVLRATVNNYGWAADRGLGKGAIVRIKKAGKIIPNVIEVVSNPVAKFEAPEHCPSCGVKLEITTSDSGNRDLTCLNKQCAAKHIKSWLFFIVKLGGKGLGLKAMEKIANMGIVKTIDDLYKLTIDQLIQHEFSERQAALALAAIWMLPFEKDNAKLKTQIEDARKQKLKADAWKFYAALGIPGSGDSDGKALIKHLKAFEPIMQQSVASLESVKGIGNKTASSIHNWFVENSHWVKDLLGRFELILPKSGNLDGLKFVLTGGFEEGKDYWKAKISDNGGECQSSVGKTTNYVIKDAGKKDGSASEKEKEAAKLNIPIKTTDDLVKMIGGT